MWNDKCNILLIAQEQRRDKSRVCFVIQTNQPVQQRQMRVNIKIYKLGRAINQTLLK